MRKKSDKKKVKKVLHLFLEYDIFYLTSDVPLFFCYVTSLFCDNTLNYEHLVEYLRR